MSPLFFSFPVLFDFIGGGVEKKKKLDWAAKAADHLGSILVFWCPSVCLTGPRSNYIRKVLFCFFSLQNGRQSPELELAVMSKSVCFLKFCLFKIGRVR